MKVIRMKHVAFTDEFNKGLLFFMAMVKQSLYKLGKALRFP
jgi:hypothetical protein